MKKMFFLPFLIVIVFLSGCNILGNQEKNLNITKETSKPEKLVVWEEPGNKTEFEQIARNFEKEFGIKVEVQQIDGSQMIEQIQKQAKEGKTPDIVTLPHTQLSNAVNKGLVLPIKIDHSVTDQYIESSIKAMTYKGYLFGVPKSVDTSVFVYNKNLLSTPPTTFNELYAYSLETTKNGQFGFLAPWDDFFYAQGVLGGYGGYVFGEKENIPNAKQLGLNSPGAVEGLTYIQKWYVEGLFPTQILGEAGRMTVDALFNEQRVATMITTPSKIASYRTAGIDLGVSQIPLLPNGKPVKSFINVNGWFVTTSSKHHEWAMTLIEYLGQPEYGKIRVQQTADVPPLKGLANDQILATNEVAKAILIQSQTGEPTPNIPQMAQVWNPMNRALQLVIGNQTITPKAALDEATKLILGQINK